MNMASRRTYSKSQAEYVIKITDEREYIKLLCKQKGEHYANTARSPMRGSYEKACANGD